MTPVDPLYLKQPIDLHYRGQPIRVAGPLPDRIDAGDVTDAAFALEQEGLVTPVRVVVRLVGSVPDGGSGVQVISGAEVWPQPTPPLDPDVVVYEAVVQTTAGVPSSWFKWELWLTVTGIGPTPIAAGRLHLREPALT